MTTLPWLENPLPPQQCCFYMFLHTQGTYRIKNYKLNIAWGGRGAEIVGILVYFGNSLNSFVRDCLRRTFDKYRICTSVH